MSGAPNRWSFLGILSSEGVAMYLDARGNLRARGQVSDPEVAGFIRAYRDQIIAELKNRPGTPSACSSDVQR
jgi:hypothetical protein